MKEKREFFAFCNKQSRFIRALGKLHIIKPAGGFAVTNPFNERVECWIQDAYCRKWVYELATRINDKLMDQSGREREQRLVDYGYLKVTRD